MHLPDPTISTFGLLCNQQNKKHNSCTFIIHMTNVNYLKIWDPKMLFLVAELINKMIEQYQTAGVKYHFHPVSLISIKHLIHQHTTASKHCNPIQSMIKFWESIRFSNIMKLMNKIEKQYSNIKSCVKYGLQLTFLTQSQR